MRFTHLVTGLIYGLLFSLSSFTAAQANQNLLSITILCEPSLTEPMAEIQKLYAKEHRINVATIYDASANLIDYITQGESANVIITSDPKWIQSLKQQGLVDAYTFANLASNQLVLAVPKQSLLSSYKDMSSPQNVINSLIMEHQPLVISAPIRTALGEKSKQIFEHYTSWQAVAPLIMPAPHSRRVMYLVQNSNAPGIMYKTDAINHPSFDILTIFPSDSHDPVIYQAAVVAGENMDEGRNFVNSLSTPKYQEILKKYGFILDY